MATQRHVGEIFVHCKFAVNGRMVTFHSACEIRPFIKMGPP